MLDGKPELISGLAFTRAELEQGICDLYNKYEAVEVLNIFVSDT